MRTRADVVAVARTWLGTPYHHQASIKGVGADCIGFVKGVALEAGLITQEMAEGLPIDYSRQQTGGRLRRIMGDLLIAVPSSEVLPADVFLMRIAGEDSHIGLYTDLGIIHCHSDVKGVVEQRLDSDTRKMISRAYRFRSL
ncbi:MAG: NlpC/P60 family protein [Gammaproteobacteria bacterium]